MSSTVVITIKARKEWENLDPYYLHNAIGYLLNNTQTALKKFAPKFKGFDPIKKHWFRRIYENLLSRVTKSCRLPIDLANKLKSIPNWQEVIRNIIHDFLNPSFNEQVFDQDAYEELCYQCFDAVEAKKFITVHSKGEWKEMLINMLDDLREDYFESRLGSTVYYGDLETHAAYLIDRKNHMLKRTGKPTWLTSLYVTVAKTIRTFIQ